MTEKEQIEHLDLEINKVIDRIRKEYDMTYAAVIGVLQIKIMSLHDDIPDDDELSP